MEPGLMSERGGWIEVVCGPMFSGKTEELIRRLKRALIGRQRVQAFKPKIDDRYASEALASHAGRKLDAVAVADVDELRSLIAPDAEVVGIDEVQFFDASIVELISELADGGVRVITAGLDLDYQAQPFGPIPTLLAKAESVTKVLAVCVLCARPASRSHRISEEQGLHVVGATDRYQPLCRHCYAHKKGEASQLATQGRLPFGWE